MNIILRKIVNTSTAVFRNLFPSPEKKKEMKLLKTGDRLFKGIVLRLKVNKETPAYGRKLLLHRRLRQYQRMRRHGSVYAKLEALKKLEKEWRKFQRDCKK